INGDALPDLLNTSDDGPHTFLLNVPTTDGTARFAPDDPVTSAVPEAIGSSFRLGTQFVQVLDVNGDGFTDLLHAQTGEMLINRGNGDWERVMNSDTNAIADVIDEGQTFKFLDYNNDKRIDVLRSTRSTTSIYRNFGLDGFGEDEGIEPMGYGIQADNIDFTDMNGDGLLDPVKLNVGGLRYKLNLGWGRWSDEIEVLGLPIEESELGLASLEDLNGDGLSDLVVVVGSNVKYAINRNGSQFSDITTLSSSAVEGIIPQRDGSTTVLYADMNGNGSTDIVWLSSQGQVDVLELFPVRPNQMSRIENGLGQVTTITYGTSVQHMARDGGWQAWQYRLPHPMLVVDRRDTYDRLTNVHEVTEYSYSDGFYDGIEKQFRGYARVETRLIGDDAQQSGVTQSLYDVGANDAYTNGLLLAQSIASDGRDLNLTENSYSDCDLTGIPDNTDLPIRFICQTATETVLKEGLPESEWVTLQSETEYDGYGNVTRAVNHGVTSIGAAGCEPCNGRDPEAFGKPCGPQCIGDESTLETAYINPGPDTSGRWILGRSHTAWSYGDPNSTLRTETQTYYDGEPFIGMNLGSLDQGNVTRVTVKKEVGSDEVIAAARNRYDDHGNVIETIDPNGVIGGNTHRRVYVMDEDQ
ncbi:MAG: toxin TcdB middle/N-terminal domain-containing protein, partial [Myxococcota bacterium]